MATTKHHQSTPTILGFAYFYCRFISSFSQVCAPLTSLLRNKPKSLSWTSAAIEDFHQLKEAFCTAPTLAQPDHQLVIEVDASTVWVRGVLSQHHREPHILHSCAFYSKKLSLVEQNYDIGNRELLAIKLVIEVWRHWFTHHPSEVITDHRNLEYINKAKRLNP